jgi:hypothetical protein
MHNHTQVDVDHDGEMVKVDEGMSEIMSLLWKHGIETLGSCQENQPGIAWVQFASTPGFHKFLNIVAKFPAEEGADFLNSLYARIGHHAENEKNWEFAIQPYNVNEVVNETVDEDGNETLEITCDDDTLYTSSVSVSFPATDLPELVGILKAAPVEVEEP